jgi:hypothetical protein
MIMPLGKRHYIWVGAWTAENLLMLEQVAVEEKPNQFYQASTSVHWMRFPTLAA